MDDVLRSYEMTRYLKAEYTSVVESAYQDCVRATVVLTKAFEREPYSYRCLALSEKLYSFVRKFMRSFRALIEKWNRIQPKNDLEKIIMRNVAEEIIPYINHLYKDIDGLVCRMVVSDEMNCDLKQKIANGIEIFIELRENMICLDERSKSMKPDLPF